VRLVIASMAIAAAMALARVPTANGGGGGAPLAAGAVRVVGCGQRVEATQPSGGQVRQARRTSIVAGNLTLWGIRRARNASFGARARDGWKAGVSVRGYRAVTVRVAARHRRWLALNYVSGRHATDVSSADPAVRFEPCPPGTLRFSDGRPLGAETSWAGAFAVARAGCATLWIRRAGSPRSTPVRVGFGVRCA
jgi:hypothetical protein